MVSSHYGNTLQLVCLRMKLRLRKARKKNTRLPAEQTQYNAPIKGCSFISARDVCPIQYAICLLSALNDKANYSNLVSFSVPQRDSKSLLYDWQRIGFGLSMYSLKAGYFPFATYKTIFSLPTP